MSYKRVVPKVIDVAQKVGGLYMPVFVLSLVLSIVFFDPIDDLDLLMAWKDIEEK